MPQPEDRALAVMLRTEKVLRAVELVPRGQVVAFGQLGAVVGVGARQVGQVLANHGRAVAWWRVVSASGALPAHLLPEARAHWHVEGIALRRDGNGCRIADHGCDLDALATAWQEAAADLER